MGLFELLKINKNEKKDSATVKMIGKKYADSKSISEDERPFYQPDSYYTLSEFPGTQNEKRVISFEERKKSSFPSSNGLYVAEIMLLEYCSYGKYPKPSSGYPSFWWFEYGIRDVGHALESLYQRGFLTWAPKKNAVNSLKVEELKQILQDAGLSISGKKADLIERVINSIPETELTIPDYIPKYELTRLGKDELEKNGYVVYMHNHPHKTTENSRFGPTFTVWDINKLFPNGNAENWRKVVGAQEKKRFGVDIANAASREGSPNQTNPNSRAEEMRDYLKKKSNYIANAIRSRGDGFAEESRGLDLVRAGKDKEALIQFYIAVGKKFDAPALYRETANLLQKYGMTEEAVSVLDEGLKNVPKNNRHREEFVKMKQKIKK